MEAQLDVTFIEPTVGGLTGAQHQQLRLWEEEQRCAFEYFGRDERGPAERCIEEPVEGSRYCEDHMPELDGYDSWRDREFDE